MGHAMGGMKNKWMLGIGAVLLVGALIAVYGFNVSWGRLAPFAFLAFFAWMHLGGHGMHGGHGGPGDAASRNEHASDHNAPPLAPDAKAASGAREDSRQHGGC